MNADESKSLGMELSDRRVLSDKERRLLLFALRALMSAILLFLPTIIWSYSKNPNDINPGATAFVAQVHGVIIGLINFVLGSVGHLFLPKLSLRSTVVLDFGIFLCLWFYLLYGWQRYLPENLSFVRL